MMYLGQSLSTQVTGGAIAQANAASQSANGLASAFTGSDSISNKVVAASKLFSDVTIDISDFRAGATSTGDMDIQKLLKQGVTITNNGQYLMGGSQGVAPLPASANGLGGMTNFNTPPTQLWGGAGGVPQWAYDETGTMRPVVNFLDKTSGQGMYFDTGASINGMQGAYSANPEVAQLQATIAQLQGQLQMMTGGGGYPQPAMGGQQPRSLRDLQMMLNPPASSLPPGMASVPQTGGNRGGSGGGLRPVIGQDGSIQIVQSPRTGGGGASSAQEPSLSPELIQTLLQGVKDGSIDYKALESLLGVSLPSSLSSVQKTKTKTETSEEDEDSGSLFGGSSSSNTGSSSGLDSLFINSDEDLEAALEGDSSDGSLFLDD
jgi:hypothetical protein